VYNIRASQKRKDMNMDNSKKLPEAEYDVMVALWNSEVSPVNTAYLMENVGRNKGWKAPTLISFLTRLEDRGFIHSEKKGKERYYYADAIKDEYIKSVTNDFLTKYHGGSFVKMMDLLYENQSLSVDELDEMLKWLQEQY
jgi:predicted transcriptional regulator